MRKVAIIVGILVGAALAFVACGGLEVAAKVGAAMNANAPASAPADAE